MGAAPGTSTGCLGGFQSPNRPTSPRLVGSHTPTAQPFRATAATTRQTPRTTSPITCRGSALAPTSRMRARRSKPDIPRESQPRRKSLRALKLSARNTLTRMETQYIGVLFAKMERPSSVLLWTSTVWLVVSLSTSVSIRTGNCFPHRRLCQKEIQLPKSQRRYTGQNGRRSDCAWLPVIKPTTICPPKVATPRMATRVMPISPKTTPADTMFTAPIY